LKARTLPVGKGLPSIRQRRVVREGLRADPDPGL